MIKDIIKTITLVILSLVHALLAKLILGGTFPQLGYGQWFGIMLVASLPVSAALSVDKMFDD